VKSEKRKVKSAKCLLRLGAFVLVATCLGAAASADEPRSHLFFAFDDHAIPWHHNTKVTLVEAEKHPDNPVLRRGPKGSPDGAHAILYGTVLHDGEKFRMWYLGMIEDELKDGQAPGWWRPMCYAESDDGVNWVKPELGLVELNGNKRNNICLIGSDPHSLSRVNDFLSVLYEPEDPDPSRRYKAAYIAHVPFEDVNGGRSAIGPDESRWGALICATSADGLSWKVVGDRPMNAGGERFEVSSLYRFGDFYYAGGQLISPWAFQRDGRDIGRVMLTYRSADFNHWSKAKALSFARSGQLAAAPVAGQQVHMGAGLWNRGNVLVGLYGMWQDGPKGVYDATGATIDLGLVVSNDGIHFREPVDGFKVIPRGEPGEWDSIALLQGHAFANVNDRTYIWYSHWNTHGALDDMEIGLATLRRDGFGYLSRHTKGQDAHAITANLPAAKDGYRLSVNVEGVRPGAALQVELLDRLGRPLPEFSGAGAAKIETSGTSVELAWPAAGKPSPLDEPFAVQIRFPDDDEVRLYAVYAEPVVSPQEPPGGAVTMLSTSTGVRFGIWPARPAKPAPTLIVLATTPEATLANAYYRQAGDVLAQRGYLLVSVDLPCHGAERREGEPEGLDGWRKRCERGENFVADLTARLSAVLDHLIAEKMTDPERIAVCGTSRGGYSALQFAAADPRVKCVAAFSPVTDLTALREFRGAEENPLVKQLAIAEQAGKLAQRPVWIAIGDRDARVDTDRAIAFARRVTAASLEQGHDSRVDFHVLAQPKGHSTPDGAAEQAAEWIDRQLK
jgi:dienelactone hydrolase